jgi:hypothetical protein
MEWYEIVLMILLCMLFGFALGYMLRDSQSRADAEEREQTFFDEAMRQAKNFSNEEAERIGKIIAKQMADNILRRRGL